MSSCFNFYWIHKGIAYTFRWDEKATKDSRDNQSSPMGIAYTFRWDEKATKDSRDNQSSPKTSEQIQSF